MSAEADGKVAGTPEGETKLYDTRVTRIEGAPGAGKTYTLTQTLKREVEENGLRERGFWWLTFTNAGRKDVEPEIGETFADFVDEHEDDIIPEDRAKTFHGLALSLAKREGLIGEDEEAEQIIEQKQFRHVDPDDEEVNPFADFCDRRGMRYDPEASNARQMLSGGKTDVEIGNKLFAINDYLRQTCKPPRKWRDAEINVSIHGSTVVKLLKEWDEYKRDPPHVDYRLFEHGDYIDLVYEHKLLPNVDVLMIDEFQDLAPIEYRLYKLWRDSGVLRAIYIAGDPNQAMYSFRGGTPYYFENTDYDEQEPLKASRRFGSVIANFASDLLGANPDCDQNGVTGYEEGGVVDHITVRSEYDLREKVTESAKQYGDSDPSTLLLTRTNYQLYQLTRDLKDVGVPFEILGTSKGVWRGDLRKILTLANNLEDGDEPFDSDNLRAVMSNLGRDLHSGYRDPTTGNVDRRMIEGGCNVIITIDTDRVGEVDDEEIAAAFDPEPIGVDSIDTATSAGHQYFLTFAGVDPTEVYYTDDAIVVDKSETLEPLFGGLDGPREIVEAMNLDSWKEDVLLNAIDAPAGMSPSDVQVGTIHTAKGLEAPCVYLFAEWSEKMSTRYRRDPKQAAEEHRVYYVGATRASEELHIVEDYFDGPVAAPLDLLRRGPGVSR